MDLGRTRGKIKRQRRHSKSDNVEKVFWCGNSEENKKKGSVKMSKHKFSMKKKKEDRKKHKGIFRPFKKIKKWKQMRSFFLFQSKRSFFLKKKKKTNNCFFFNIFC